MSNINNYLLKYRYLILSMFTIIIMIIIVFNSAWHGDFYFHTAAVNELKYNPINPRNHYTNLDTPTADFSPYHLIIALFSRWTRLDVISMYGLAGILNLILFLIFLYLFSIKLSGNKNIPFYLLFFTLILYGEKTWTWSGFFNIRNLETFSYPSSICGVLLLVEFYLYIFMIKEKKYIFIPIISILSSIIFLTHPLTAMFLYIGFFSFTICIPHKKILIHLVRLLFILVLSFFLSSLWSYYPWFKLFNLASIKGFIPEITFYKYPLVFLRILPVIIIGTPIFFVRLKKNWKESLNVMLIILLMIYVVGYIFKIYMFGRLMPSILFVIHFMIAYSFVKYESKLVRHNYIPTYKKIFYIIATLFILISGIQQSKSCLKRLLSPLPIKYKEFEFLNRFVSHYNVVIAPPKISFYIPSFSGKVLTHVYDTDLFIPDHITRKEAMLEFFDEKITNYRREQIIDKYNVKYILFNTENLYDLKKYHTPSKKLITSLDLLGDVVYNQNNFILIKLHSS